MSDHEGASEHTMHPQSTRFVTRWLAAAILSMMTLTTYSATNPQTDNPEYRWDLSELYPSPQAWTLEHDKILAQADALDKYQDTLGHSATDMLTALRAISATKKESARLSTYASPKCIEDFLAIGGCSQRLPGHVRRHADDAGDGRRIRRQSAPLPERASRCNLCRRHAAVGLSHAGRRGEQEPAGAVSLSEVAQGRARHH